MVNHNSQGPGHGAINILHRIGLIIIDMVETRLQLVAVELEEEKHHVLGLLMMAGVCLISLTFGIMSLLILICWSIDPAHRFTVLAIFTGVLLLISLVCAIATFKRSKAKKVLAATRHSLKVDKQLLIGEKCD